MDQRLRNFYLESQVNNASPGDRLIMLYEALISNAEIAEMEISYPTSPNERAKAAFSISRCIDIMTELSSCLKFEFNPDLCNVLNDLYLFFTREFSDAFDKCEPERIRAILPLIHDLKKTWTEANRLANQPQAMAA